MDWQYRSEDLSQDSPLPKLSATALLVFLPALALEYLVLRVVYIELWGTSVPLHVSGIIGVAGATAALFWRLRQEQRTIAALRTTLADVVEQTNSEIHSQENLRKTVLTAEQALVELAARFRTIRRQLIRRIRDMNEQSRKAQKELKASEARFCDLQKSIEGQLRGSFFFKGRRTEKGSLSRVA